MTEAIFSKKETILKNESARLLTLQVQRIPEGIRLYVKSPIFEKFFGACERIMDRDNYETWDDKEGYTLSNAFPTNEFRSMFNGWGLNQLMIMYRDPSGNHALDHYVPNLAFLRTVGLKDGIIMTLPTVLTRAQIAEFMGMVKESTQKAYKDFMKPVGMTLEIITDDNVTDTSPRTT